MSIVHGQCALFLDHPSRVRISARASPQLGLSEGRQITLFMLYIKSIKTWWTGKKIYT